MKRTSTLVLTAFFALFVSIGLAMLGFAGRAWWKSTQVEQWPSVEGELLQRSLDESSDSDGSTWKVNVRYAYTVAGRRHEGDRVAFGYVGSSGRASHEAIYDKLMRGDRVRVRYNPADPAEAALAHGLRQRRHGIRRRALRGGGRLSGRAGAAPRARPTVRRGG